MGRKESNFNRIKYQSLIPAEILLTSLDQEESKKKKNKNKNKTVITNLLTMICGATAVGEGFFF